MPRTCSVCRHKNVDLINTAFVAKQPYRHISVRFGITIASLHRHGKSHIPDLLATAESRSRESAETLASQVKALELRMASLLKHAEEIVNEAKESGDARLRLAAIKEAVGAIRSIAPLLELHGRVSGELTEKPAKSAAARVVILLPERAEVGAPPSELMRYRQEQAIQNQTVLGEIIDVEPIIRELEPDEFRSDGDDNDPDELESGELDSDE